MRLTLFPSILGETPTLRTNHYLRVRLDVAVSPSCFRSLIKHLVLLTILIIPTGAWALDTSVEEFTCTEIGFKSKTEKFANCVLELYERKNKGGITNSVGSRQADSGAQSQQGDGSLDDQTCQRYGLKPGQPEYGNCRIQIHLAKQQAAREQARYEAEMAAYEHQKQELEAEQKRKLAMRQLQLGLGLMLGQITLEDIGRSSMGLPPAPRPPAIQNLTIRLPGGAIVNCTTTGTFTNCR